MSTVHGVYLKYVVLSFVSYALLYYLAPDDAASIENAKTPQWVLSSLAYMAFLNAIIAMLFKMEVGMGMLGKNEITGKVPIWSYVLFAGFHLPTWLYTTVHKFQDSIKGVAAADKVLEGWWIGGRYGGELGRKWAGIVDLTCEFPESCQGIDAESYLLLRCWDGVPPTTEQLECAAKFAVERRAKGDVIVHCAHGRGRSTTVMCACLVKAGQCKDWEEAFETIKAKRTCVKLNKRMREALTLWQASHDGKKAK